MAMQGTNMVDYYGVMFGQIVTSECTALLGRKSGIGGVSDSGFSLCTAPTYYCGSEYF